MADLESLYLRLPIPLQQLICSLEGWRIQQRRFGRGFQEVLAEIESRAFWDPGRIAEYRDQRLRSFIRHCVETVPYYRRLFRELGASPDDIHSPADLQRLPILSKQTVQDRREAFFSEAIREHERVSTHTSGTTGAGLRFASTARAVQEQWAVWWRYRRWHGIQPGTWCGYFAGRSVVPARQTRPPFWRYNYPGRQILFSGYHMSPSNLRAYIAELRRRQPPWLHGYPSLLALLAAYLLDSRQELGYPLAWITIASENLLDHQAALLERAFGVRPRQHYGMTEAVANISECDQGRLHVDEDFAAVEFVPNPDGLGWKIIGTNFTNSATALIRYDTKDFVTLSDQLCGCGRPGRVVECVDGRMEDYVVLKDGSRLGRMDHIFKDMENIREAQIYQRLPGEFQVRIVRGRNYSKQDELALLREIRKRVGNGAEAFVEYVEQLDRSRTGKLRFVVSQLSSGQLERVGDSGA